MIAVYKLGENIQCSKSWIPLFYEVLLSVSHAWATVLEMLGHTLFLVHEVNGFSFPQVWASRLERNIEKLICMSLNELANVINHNISGPYWNYKCWIPLVDLWSFLSSSSLEILYLKIPGKLTCIVAVLHMIKSLLIIMWETCNWKKPP